MGKLYVVATPIGNLLDMTKRAVDILREVDLVLAEDTRYSIKLFNHFDIKTQMVSYHKFNEKKKSEDIINEIKEKDIDIALITDAGTPCISDPGYEIIKRAHEEGIMVSPIPGASAAIAALSVSGFDTDRFAFYGFLPRENKQVKAFFEDVRKDISKVLVFYESPKRIKDAINNIKAELGNINIAVMRELTKMHETIYRGDIDSVIEKIEEDKDSEKGEYVIVVEKGDNYNEDVEQCISKEAYIIDEMIRGGLNLKEAVDVVYKKYDLRKKDVYDAGLTLKKLLR